MGVETGTELQNRPEPEFGGLANQVDGPLLIVDTGIRICEDGLTLACHLRLTHAESVNPVADDVDRLIERLVGDLLSVGQRFGLEDD